MSRLFVLLFAGLLSLSAYAAPGDFDTSFGGGAGWVSTGFEGISIARGQDVILQADGKLVVAGNTVGGCINSNCKDQYLLMRYHANGWLDTSFNGTGKVITDFGSYQPAEVIQQADGKLVVAGTDKDMFALARYNLNGSLDTTFDTDGMVSTGISYRDTANAIIQQSDGKLVVVGVASYINTGGTNDFAVVRYNPDGSLDSTFSDDGKLNIGIDATSHDHALTVIQQADGKLVVAGNNNADFALIRLNPDGSLDGSFDGDGKLVTTMSGGPEVIFSLVQQPDGKLVAAGSSLVNGKDGFALARYNADGSLDTAFSGDGKVKTEIGAGKSYGESIVLQLDGKLVVAGYASNGTDDDFALARYNADGSLDTAFNGSGTLMTALGTGADQGNAVVLQPDGKLVMAGSSSSQDGSSASFALARYHTNGALDSTFSGDGKVLTAGVPVSKDTGQSTIQQDDGKLVVAGYATVGGNYHFALMRYNPDGSLDTELNGSGKLTTSMSSSDDFGRAVIQQTDGKLVVAGYGSSGYSNDFALARYNRNGTLDTSFSGDGKLTTAIGTSYDDAFDVIQQADGKLVVAGYAQVGSYADFALVRYNGNGSLDASFSGDGKLTTAIGIDDKAYTVIQQRDGKLVVAGSSSNGSRWDVALARYNANGSLDTSFNGAGSVTTAIGTGAGANSVIQQADGKLVAAGYATVGGLPHFALARYNTDGSLDSSFNGTGKIITALGTGTASASSVIQQADGKLVVAGYWIHGSAYSDVAVVRYNLDGSLDTTFSNAGKLTMVIDEDDAAAHAVIEQQDGKLVIAGYANKMPAGREFFIARIESGQLDLDADGYMDALDPFPVDPTEWLDTDSDGTGNNADPDDDNDGLPDVMDPLPLQVKFNLDSHYQGNTVQDSTTVP